MKMKNNFIGLLSPKENNSINVPQTYRETYSLSDFLYEFFINSKSKIHTSLTGFVSRIEKFVHTNYLMLLTYCSF
ncbi:hypothetical protein MHN29_02665 [Tenacibaculum sp. Cn5-46]|uniref:hypothetical protein n=1 Tax=Tenacibaculum sp. Cn5-46 TaxID=2917761 RepID=UPI001EF16932|nr:hypothetical protein [Tenacibaculum sp. Cn5-46]MCG7509952.1 hypothetical protein [Tenacibaculum sp. Cn5-46]